MHNLKSGNVTTLDDLARKTGLSVSTISRALSPNKSHLVGKKSMKIIEETLAGNVVRVDSSARQLRSRKTFRIALVLRMDFLKEPPIYPEFSLYRENLLYKMMEAVNHEVTSNRYEFQLLPLFGQQSADILLESVGYPHNDGVILFWLDNQVIEDVHARIRSKGVPAVVLSSPPLSNADIPEVLTSYAEGYDELLEYAMRRGHSNFAVISLDCDLRKQAVTDALKAHDVYRDEFFFNLGNRAIIEDWLDSWNGKFPFSVVLCQNDCMASILLEEMRARNLKAPMDLAVTGWDNHPYFAMKDNITTIHNPAEERARIAVEMLLRMLEEKEIDKKQYAKTHLKARSTC